MENAYSEPPEKFQRDLITQEFLKASQKKRGKWDCLRQFCAMTSLCCSLLIGLLMVTTLWIGLIVFLIIGSPESEKKKVYFKFSSFPDSKYQGIIQPNTTFKEYQWIGGDSSASVTVPFRIGGKEYSIFLYGDSLFGKVNKYGNRIRPPLSINMTMINNLVGMYTPSDMNHIDLVPRINESAPLISRYQSLFLPWNNNSIHIWAMQGVVISKNETFFYLFIFTPRVVNDPKRMVLDGFGVIRCGILKKVVLNPLLWDCRYHDIQPHEGDLVYGYVGNYEDNTNVYMLGKSVFHDESVLCRIRKEYLVNLQWEYVEYWSRGDIWTHSPHDLKPLKNFPATTETTLNFNNFMKKYYTILIPKLFTYDAYIYIADEITGPYEKIGPIFSVSKRIFNSTENLIAYGVKSHPQLVVEENEILVTYNTNSWPPTLFAKMFYKMKELVIPQFERIKIEKISKDG